MLSNMTKFISCICIYYLTGICQEQERIHICYRFNQNRINQIKVTVHHTTKSLSQITFKKGELIIVYAGYGTAQNYIYAHQQRTDVILRIILKTFFLYDADGEKISLIVLLKQAEEQVKCLMAIFGWCRYKNKTGFIRVVAQKLPKEQAEKSRKRKRRKASKN